MTHKVTVGLQKKIGQPNFGSVGASCNIEVLLDDDEANYPEVVANRVTQAFAQCNACIEKELAQHASPPSQDTTAVSGANVSADRSHPTPIKSAERSNPRQATDAQVRAIRAIASKAGLSLASELERRGYERTRKGGGTRAWAGLRPRPWTRPRARS